MYINPRMVMAEQTPDAFKEESACRGWIEAHESVGPCSICSGDVEGLHLRCRFLESLKFHPELHCEASPLLRLGSSSRALGGSRSLKQIGRCHGQIWMPLKPLFILVIQKVIKTPNWCCLPRVPELLKLCSPLPTLRSWGYWEHLSSNAMRREEDSLLPPLLSRGPSAFPASSFLIPFLPGMPVNSNPPPAVQVRQHREQLLQPSRMAGDQRSRPSPDVAIWAWRSFTPYTIHSRKRGCSLYTNLIFIQNPVLHELSDLLFLMAKQCTVTLPLGLSN